MKLIGSLTSPYVRKVRIVLAEKKIEYDFELETENHWQLAEGAPDLNPLGKIPLLVLDDGNSLFDSRVIVEYIDNVTPNNKLFPTPNRERTEVKRWEALADGICDAAASAFSETKRSRSQKSVAWIERQRERIARSLGFMENALGQKNFCMGTHISMADLAVGAALSYLEFRFKDIKWQETCPNLLRLYEKLNQRQSFIDTMLTNQPPPANPESAAATEAA